MDRNKIPLLLVWGSFELSEVPKRLSPIVRSLPSKPSVWEFLSGVCFVFYHLAMSLFSMGVGRLYLWCYREGDFFIDFKIIPRRNKDPLNVGGHSGGVYFDSLREGLVTLQQRVDKTQWYTTYNHELIHAVLHKRLGLEACRSFDKIAYERETHVPDDTKYFHDQLIRDLVFGIDRDGSWLPELNPYVRDTPELVRRRRLLMTYYGIDIGSRGRSSTTAEG